MLRNYCYQEDIYCWWQGDTISCWQEDIDGELQEYIYSWWQEYIEILKAGGKKTVTVAGK